VKRIISFDLYEGGAADVLDGLSPYRSMAGVRSIELLTALEGSPRYCIVFDLEDEADATVAARLEAARAPHAASLANYSSRAFRRVG
jgi:hypothetical protein